MKRTFHIEDKSISTDEVVPDAMGYFPRGSSSSSSTHQQNITCTNCGTLFEVVPIKNDGHVKKKRFKTTTKDTNSPSCTFSCEKCDMMMIEQLVADVNPLPEIHLRGNSDGPGSSKNTVKVLPKNQKLKERPQYYEGLNIRAVQQSEEEYPMNHKNRGRCLIFNHKNYNPETDENKREGTDADAVSLCCMFGYLGFFTRIYNDLTKEEVIKKLKEAGEDNYSDDSCIVICILTHGNKETLWAKDKEYPTKSVFAPFQEDVCPSLRGKPKIFLFQACRGHKKSKAVKILYMDSPNNSNSQSMMSTSEFQKTTDPDFLVAYSTVPGYVSWRDTSKGSWFIQRLCKVLRRHFGTKDMLHILTIVNRRVALDEPEDPQRTEKQMPLITTTLTKDLKFYEI